MQETRNNCFGSKKRSTTLCQAKTNFFTFQRVIKSRYINTFKKTFLLFRKFPQVPEYLIVSETIKETRTFFSDAYIKLSIKLQKCFFAIKSNCMHEVPLDLLLSNMHGTTKNMVYIWKKSTNFPYEFK